MKKPINRFDNDSDMYEYMWHRLHDYILGRLQIIKNNPTKKDINQLIEDIENFEY